MSMQSSSHPTAGDVATAQEVLEQLFDGRRSVPDATAFVGWSDGSGLTFDDVFGLDY